MSIVLRNIGIFVFGIVAAFVGLLAWGDRGGSDIPLSAFSNSSTTLGSEPTPIPLTPIAPESIEQNAPIVAYANYSENGVLLSGAVNAPVSYTHLTLPTILLV